MGWNRSFLSIKTGLSLTKEDNAFSLDFGLIHLAIKKSGSFIFLYALKDWTSFFIHNERVLSALTLGLLLYLHM